MTVPTDLDPASATPPTGPGCSTPPTTSSTASSARCSRPSPIAASRGSRTTPTPSRSSSGSHASPAHASSASPRALDAARRELDDYFAGRRRLRPRARPQGPAPFAVAVLDELARVPYGHTSTYGELATRAGNPRAARAVGMVMNRNPIPIVLPCHRIVGASGSLVGYGGGLERKEQLLRLEGAIL